MARPWPASAWRRSRWAPSRRACTSWPSSSFSAPCAIISASAASARPTPAAPPLGPEIFLFFRALGINLKQVYGQTESGVTCVQRDGDVSLGTVGKPFPNVEMAVSDDGEVLVNGPMVFKGYYKDEAATAAALKDSWL